MTIKNELSLAIKDAMRARDKKTLETLRLISSAFKQVEVDERIEIDDARALIILDKMAKQRNESITQFEAANRQDLVAQEQFELSLIKSYLPEPFSDELIQQHVDETLSTLSADKVSDMARVMSHLKPIMQGRADMAKVSALVKARLN